jgi:predicted PurR-regulated permease PerM
MDRIDWSRALTVLLVIIATIVVAAIAWNVVHALLHTLMLFVAAAILAFILSPLVDHLERVAPGRLTAVAALYLGLGVVAIAAVVLLAQPVATQASALIASLPRGIQELQSHEPEITGLLDQYGVRANVAEIRQQVLAELQASGTLLLGNVLQVLGGLANAVVDIILVMVISFYLLLDGGLIRDRALAVVPAQHREKFVFIQDSVARVVGGYLRGQLIMALTVGILAGAGTYLLGVPYALILGVLAGIFELIPMFGPILASLPAILVALFQPFPLVVWVLAYFVVIQQIESHILLPRISGHAVGLHPLGALFALLAGLEVAGLLGGLFAVPIAGLLFVFLGTVYRRLLGLEDPVPARRSWRIVRRGQPSIIVPGQADPGPGTGSRPPRDGAPLGATRGRQ